MKGKSGCKILVCVKADDSILTAFKGSLKFNCHLFIKFSYGAVFKWVKLNQNQSNHTNESYILNYCFIGE